MTDAASGRCLVIGSGGVTGIAWAVGVVAALADAAVELREADVFVGTSAGAVVAIELAGDVPTSDLLRRQRAEADHEVARPYSQQAADEKGRNLLERADGDATAARRRVGAAALRASTPGLEERRAIVASRLSTPRWPARPVRVVAVDAASGERRVFDASSGVDLADAVMASCAVPAVWPAVPIGGRHYIDGGVWSTTNADVAGELVGCRSIVVVAPLGYGDANPLSGRLRVELAELSARGRRTCVIVPDAASVRAMGENVLDPAARGPAADAGYAQGAADADRIRAHWSASS